MRENYPLIHFTRIIYEINFKCLPSLHQSWPVTLDTDDTRKGRLPGVYRAPTAEMLSYLDFSVSTTGMLAGIKMSHASTTALCRFATVLYC